MTATDDRVDLPFDPIAGDVVCRRDPDGLKRFNVPRRHVHHSPTGMEWGYEGSGPADYALNILTAFLPPAGPVPEQPADDASAAAWDAYDAAIEAAGVELRDGSRVNATAWELHQPFKRDVVGQLPTEGGTIPGEAIRAWLRNYGAVVADQGMGDRDKLPLDADNRYRHLGEAGPFTVATNDVDLVIVTPAGSVIEASPPVGFHDWLRERDGRLAFGLARTQDTQAGVVVYDPADCNRGCYIVPSDPVFCSWGYMPEDNPSPDDLPVMDLTYEPTPKEIAQWQALRDQREG